MEEGGDALIIEGLLTTRGADGQPNLAPMGPRIEGDFERLILRPFAPSTTYRNLKQSRLGIFHVTDDACLIARAAIGALMPAPQLQPIQLPDGEAFLLPSACRWYAARVETVDDRHPRTVMACRVTQRGQWRDFVGFHRARHALIEVAILATRTHLLDGAHLLEQLAVFKPLVEKTGDHAERETWDLLEAYITQRVAERSTS